ncbi:MAG: hypothetical protein EON84_13375 [Bradyrhizobiaceae bacterium]|nr:MAG: hypothetical protein EON84_13375 [Bradyrhizobiaceae bacterium]
MTESTAEPLTIMKAMCSVCGAIRNCEIRGYAVESWDDAGGMVWGRTSWYLLQCRGCDHMFCHTVKIFSEEYDREWDPATQEDVIVYDEAVAYWPAILKRKQPDWFSPMGFVGDKDNILYGAMHELYVALENDLSRLAASGVRTAFDIASELLDVDPSLTFKEKLDTLVARNRITSLDRDSLETLTEAGSASIHRGWVPDAADLSTMVDLLEHFIYSAFVAPTLKKKLDEKTAKLRETVPARKPRVKMEPVAAKPSTSV